MFFKDHKEKPLRLPLDVKSRYSYAKNYWRYDPNENQYIQAYTITNEIIRFTRTLAQMEEHVYNLARFIPVRTDKGWSVDKPVYGELGLIDSRKYGHEHSWQFTEGHVILMHMHSTEFWMDWNKAEQMMYDLAEWVDLLA